MLTHHGSRPYAVAAEDAITRWRAKQEDVIAKGKLRAEKTIGSILQEFQVRKDMLVPSHAIKYELAPYNENNPDPTLGLKTFVSDRPFNFTSHSLGQLLGRLGFPKTYAEKLAKANQDWSRELLLKNLHDLTGKVVNGDRLLFRTVGDTAKGILSSAYRRMDAGPILETFLSEGMRAGLVPIDGLNTETRYMIRMMHQEIFQPAPDEVLCFGLGITTSDYGASAFMLNFFLLRLWCTNFATGENCMRQVHLGKRFAGGDEEETILSQETYDLDTKTIASAVRDIIREGVDQKIEQTCKLIEDANLRGVDVKKELESLQRKGTLTKDMVKTAETLYENVNEITLLPQSKSAWRLSNVLSLMAQGHETDKKLELEEAAMAVLK